MSTRSSPICLLTNWAGYRLFSRSETLSPDFNYALTMSDTVPVTARATRDRLWRSPLGMLLGVTLLGLEEAGLTAQAWGISRAGAEYEEEEEQEQEQVGEGDSLETLRTPHGVDGPNLSGVGTLSERSGGQGSVRMFGWGEGSWEGMGRPMGGGVSGLGFVSLSTEIPLVTCRSGRQADDTLSRRPPHVWTSMWRVSDQSMRP